MTMQNPQTCLSAELLRQLSQDELSLAKLKDVEDHVSDCERCRQLLEVPQPDPQWQDEIAPILRTPVVAGTFHVPSASGHAASGHAASGHAASGHAASGHAASGHAAFGHAAFGHAASGHAAFGHGTWNVPATFDNDERGGEGESLESTLRLLGPTDDPHMLGRNGSYEVVGVIGRGGMGVVFKPMRAR